MDNHPPPQPPSSPPPLPHSPKPQDSDMPPAAAPPSTVNMAATVASSTSALSAPTPRHGAAPRLRRLAAKPLKPLKLAASAIRSGTGSSAPTPQPTPGLPSGTSTPFSYYDDDSHSNTDSNGGYIGSDPHRSWTGSSATESTGGSDMGQGGHGSGSGGGSVLLEPPTPRRSGMLRRKTCTTSSKDSLDPVAVAQAARGPRKPLDGEEPAAYLRVRVVSAEDLVAKDRNGFSDPFLTLLMAPATRFTTPVVKRTLNPTFPQPQSTFDFPLYLSLAGVIGSRGIEGVMWDKDLMRKEYMGEMFIGVDQWFVGGPAMLWNDSLPVQTFGLETTRRRTKVTGTVTLQIGLVPPPGTDPADALKKVTSVFDAIIQRTYVGNHFGVLSVPANEGIGTVMMKPTLPTEPSQSGMGGGYQLLTSTMVAPVSGRSPKAEYVDEYDWLDDGLSSSDDEDHMEDALEGDPDGYLRDSPLPIDQSPLDQAGAALAAGGRLAPEPTAPDAGQPSSRRSSGAATPATPALGSAPATSGRSKKRIFRRPGKSKKKKNFDLGHHDGITGIVVLEIQSASDLPKLKNALRTGFDMDPFVVISFGKKVFRTRVIRHSLNPTWEEKLVFHVHEHESSFTIQMALLDWDKISGNDMIGTCTLPLAELMADAPKPDTETGLYSPGVDGKHECKDFTLPIVTNKSMPWESKHSPTLTVRAKYEPYDALRQRFWRQYVTQYDADDGGTMSYLELTSMLDSLGSTLTRETIEGYFAMWGKSPDKDELTVDEVVLCLERQTNKTRDEKRKVTLSSSDGGLSSDATAVDVNELSDRLKDNWPKTGLNGNGGTATPLPSVAIDSDAPSSDAPLNSSPGSSDQEDGSEQSSGDDLERVINIKECPLCHRPRLGKRSERDILTHLAVCASSDWSRVDRIVTATYVTSSQAQRKLVTKLLNKVAIGSYSLGANSANILVQDRLTGQFQEEKMAVYVRIGIRVLYKGARGKMASARAKKLLKSLSIKQGIKYDSPQSAADIPGFIAFHHLNVDEIRDPLDSFKTFNEFFYRRLKADARPVDEPDNPDRLVSAADCRFMGFASTTEATQIWIKGRDFTVGHLIGPNYRDIADKFDGGALAIFRLAPQDYHRFHSPVDGRIGKITDIDGEYYTVNPQAIRTSLDVYGENVRKIVPIESPQFGTVMTVWVGAMMVGSIGSSVKEGEEVKRGDELGWFAFGGSTIVCVFEKGRAVFDDDLLDNGRAAIETLVRVGMGIGRATV